jgi:alpha-L-arabinofuranosidase
MVGSENHCATGSLRKGKDTLDVSATRSEDGRTLVLKVVNPTDKPVPAQIRLTGFVPVKPVAQVTELSGSLDSANTADEPRAVLPQQRQWTHAFKDGTTRCTFLPYSITVLRFQ